jgi:hypothetical protein
MLATEWLFKTGRTWPAIPWWRTKGIAFFIVVGKDVNEATLGPGNRGRVDVAGNPA